MSKQEESPTIRRRQLGAELRRLREQSGLTGPQIAATMEWDPGKVYRLEGGRQGVKPKELRELLSNYGVSQHDLIDEFVAMAKAGKRPGWWSTYGPLSKPYETYIGIETSAAEIRCWEPILVNGLLQTAEYASAIIRGTVPDMPLREVERQVQLRLARQERTVNSRLWMILDEAVLERVVGGPGTMDGQIDHLMKLASRPQVTLQVLPFKEGAHPGTRGQFTVLCFDNGDAVYAETPAGEIYPEGELAQACRATFDQLIARALPPDKTINLLKAKSERL